MRIFGGMDEHAYALTRIAPTPSGYLHRGNAFSFAITALIAAKTGARLALRIDDLDRERYRPEYLADIFKQLDWLGIEPDFGPSSPDDFVRNFSQHHKLDAYRRAIQQLVELNLLYACSCSRKEFSARQNLHCNCLTSQRHQSVENVLRLNHLPEKHGLTNLDGSLYELNLAVNPGPIPILQKNQLPSYQIASIVDDLEMGVDLIVRGSDLLPSSGLQQHIAQKLSATRYGEVVHFHHRLIYDSNGKMSKSAGASSLLHFSTSGGTVSDFYIWLCEAIGVGAANFPDYTAGKAWLKHLSAATELNELINRVKHQVAETKKP